MADRDPRQFPEETFFVGHSEMVGGAQSSIYVPVWRNTP